MVEGEGKENGKKIEENDKGVGGEGEKWESAGNWGHNR